MAPIAASASTVATNVEHGTVIGGEPELKQTLVRTGVCCPEPALDAFVLACKRNSVPEVPERLCKLGVLNVLVWAQALVFLGLIMTPVGRPPWVSPWLVILIPWDRLGRGLRWSQLT